MLSLISIVIIVLVGVPVVIGIGFLVVYLVKQAKGASGAMADGARLQEEIERIEPDPDE